MKQNKSRVICKKRLYMMYGRFFVHKTGCIRHMASAIIRDIRIAEVQIRTAVRIDQLNEREKTI